MARILIVDDEQRMGELLARKLRKAGHLLRVAGDGEEALELLDEEPADLVMTDYRMPRMDGLQLIRELRDRHPSSQVVMMTAYGEVEHAVEAMRAGAAHYLSKPLDLDAVELLVERLVGLGKLAEENRKLKRLTERGESEMVGQSAAMEHVQELIGKVAPTDTTVLIRGESGSGKELVAKAIHRSSGRSDGSFVSVNCAALPDSLLESELFGYRKGAFTGADRDKEGLFSLADGGTIFLDELGEANGTVQSKLLRVMEERSFMPVGGNKEIQVDVRILAATHRDLEQRIESGEFREDLFYRFNVFPIDLPGLRERLDDIEPLAAHFLSAMGRKDELPSRALLDALRAYPWPGNIRELRNVLERAHILAGAEAISMSHLILPTGRGRGRVGAEPVDLNLEGHEQKLIELALKRAGGNKTKAAQLLGITRRTLYSRLERLNIPLEDDD